MVSGLVCINWTAISAVANSSNPRPHVFALKRKLPLTTKWNIVVRNTVPQFLQLQLWPAIRIKFSAHQENNPVEPTETVSSALLARQFCNYWSALIE